MNGRPATRLPDGRTAAPGERYRFPEPPPAEVRSAGTNRRWRVAGRVCDEEGRALPRARCHAFLSVLETGPAELTHHRVEGPFRTTADERGDYRMEFVAHPYGHKWLTVYAEAGDLRGWAAWPLPFDGDRGGEARVSPVLHRWDQPLATWLGSPAEWASLRSEREWQHPQPVFCNPYLARPQPHLRMDRVPPWIASDKHPHRVRLDGSGGMWMTGLCSGRFVVGGFGIERERGGPHRHWKPGDCAPTQSWRVRNDVPPREDRILVVGEFRTLDRAGASLPGASVDARGFRGASGVDGRIHPPRSDEELAVRVFPPAPRGARALATDCPDAELRKRSVMVHQASPDAGTAVFQERRAAWIRGRIRLPESMSVVRNAYGFRGMHDPRTGAYLLGPLPPGPHRFDVRARWETPCMRAALRYRFELPVSEGEVRVHNLDLRDHACLAQVDGLRLRLPVTVLDEGGEPVVDARASLSVKGNWRGPGVIGAALFDARSDGDGVAWLHRPSPWPAGPRVPDGCVAALVVEHPGRRGAVVRTFERFPLTPVTLRLPPPARLRCRVRFGGIEPAPDAALRLFATRRDEDLLGQVQPRVERWAGLGEADSLAMDGLAPGHWTVWAELSSRAVSSPVDVIVSDPPAPQSIELEVGWKWPSSAPF